MSFNEAELYKTTVASLLHGPTTQEREDLYVALLVAESDPDCGGVIKPGLDTLECLKTILCCQMGGW